MRYVVVNTTLNVVVRFIIGGHKRRLFVYQDQANRLCQRMQQGFPNSKYQVIECNDLATCGYELVY